MNLLKSLFTRKQATQEIQKMEAQAATHDTNTTEAQAILEPVITETAIEKTARLFFLDRPHIEQIVVIEKVGNKKEATVYVIDQRAGIRYTVRLAADEYLEAGCHGLAARFSNARTELVYC
jgi:hypothetical protein